MYEIPLMNFEQGFPGTLAQHVIWNLIVVQIKEEFRTCIGHTEVLLYIHWWILRGIIDPSLTIMVLAVAIC